MRVKRCFQGFFDQLASTPSLTAKAAPGGGILPGVLHVLIEEVGDGAVAFDAVAAFDHAVAFVGKDDVFHGHAFGLHLGHDLVGLRLGDTRIVGPGDHEERRFNVVDVINRRDGGHELRVLLRIAVFGGAVGAAPGAGVLEKRAPVGDADNIHRRGPQIRIHGGFRQRHESAVAAAHDYQLAGVDIALRLQECGSRGAVAAGVWSLLIVIHVNVLAAKAGAAAKVGRQHRVTTVYKALGYGTE